MESTDSGDFSVGSIVWVRRRNGSWWPGKIVGPEELSTSHLTSPRSGTPVKLLGREDASVDWYNLEKSKRVKPFRCGDFDDCILKAESAQGMPPKKREKYARREDAILHALELERQLLRKQGKSVITPDFMNSKYGKKEAATPSDSLGKDPSKLPYSKAHQLYKRKDSFHKNDIIGSPQYLQRLKEGNQLSGEDDHFDVTPRMRGLQDFGLKSASSKRKHPSSTMNGFWKLTGDGTFQAFAHGGLGLAGTTHLNGVEQSRAVCRAKRSKCVYMPADSGDSLEYETAPSGHNDLSASPVGTRLHAETLMEDNTSGFSEEETNSSETDTSVPGSDSSETEPDMDEEMPSFSDPDVGRYEAQEHRSLVDEEPDDSTHSVDMPHVYNQEPYFTNEAVSKWQLKGKRNTRTLSKRSIDTTEGRGYSYGPYSEDKAEMGGLDHGYPLSRAGLRSRNRVGLNMIDWEDGTWEDRSAWDECWDIKREWFDPLYEDRYNGRRPKYLIDVDLTVQASYQKEPVPIVSLMSKLNGKAIIGHPIQVEALEDGLSNSFFSTFDDYDDEAIDNDGGTTVPHAWRTARRTANVRVPRPHLFSTLDDDEAAGDLPFFDEGRPPFKKLSMGSSSHKASQGKRNPPHNSRVPTDRKFSKKVSKKVSLSSSLKTKTRTLSSFAIEQNGNRGMIHDSGQRDRLMKPESSGSVSTTVACIPVKLVFSRLLEKINRPPSKATAAAAAAAATARIAVLLNGDVERSS